MGLFIESGCVEILYASLLLFWITYVYFVKHYGYWEERNVPHVPAVFPFGSISDIVLGKRYAGITLDDVYKEFKDERYVGYISIRTPVILIRDPELIRLILTKHFNNFTDHSEVSGHPKEHLMRNLYFLNGQEWRDMRMKISPAYSAANIKMMFFLVKECSEVLRQMVEKYTTENDIVDTKDLLSRYTIDVIAICAFGIEANSISNKDSEFYTVAKKCFELDYFRLLKTFIHCSFPIFQKYHCFNILDSSITKFFSIVVRSSVEFKEKNNICKYDFLDLLVKLRQNQSILEEGERPVDLQDTLSPSRREGMTVEEISAEAFLFFVGAYESTSNTMMYCLYELACNTRIQEKLYCEVVEVLDRHNNDISYQALQEMSYMDQVINESLRHYPPFHSLTRKCTQDYVVPNSNLVIEKGVELVIPLYSLHHDPKHFPDPFTFDPERFNTEDGKKQHPSVYLPFGEGPRMCLGQKYGLMNVKTALATLITDYQFNITPDTDVPIQFNSKTCSTVPSKPLMLIFTRRNAKA
uniref:Cytochrome P450 n=1 Tax=Graphocephala atropunctata TaxID=36148 RepID=A0A1B6LPA4_9HEMI